MDYTIIQANAFMDVWFPVLIEMPVSSGQPVTLVGESRRRHAFVAERDVAAFAVAAAVGNPAARNTTIAVGGPEAVTLREVVHAYEEALGRSIPVRSVTPGEPIPGLPETVAGFTAALESFDSPVPMEETCRQYGVSLSNVRDFTRATPLAART
jgi:NADH dehydrogenase